MQQSFFYRGTDVATAHFWHAKCGPPPTPESVQELRFSFRSQGFFRQAQHAHFAIGLRGKLYLDEAGKPYSVGGRGIIIGHTWAIPPDPDRPGVGGCQCAPRDEHGKRAGMTQVEYYWRDGNAVYADTCAPASGLSENVDYHFVLRADATDGLHSEMQWRNQLGEQRLSAFHQDATAPIPCEEYEAFIVAAVETVDANDWAARFSDIELRWR